jgi:probable rRNA maturation factor
MSIEQPELEIRLSPGAPRLNLQRLGSLVQYALERNDTRGEIGLWICADDEIAGLHEQFMHISGPTDVMSFPGDVGYLGDIAVSFETAASQAIDASHSSAREIAYLALHGLLHLIGYDDLEPGERAEMIAYQDALIESFERETLGDWEH